MAQTSKEKHMNKLDLNKIESKLNTSLENETSESLTNWLKEKRNTMDKEQLLTVDQLASFLQVCPETVRRYVRNGDIKAVKLGRSHRFSKEQIEDFINRFAEKDLGEEPKEEDDDVDEQDSHDTDEENLDYDNI